MSFLNKKAIRDYCNKRGRRVGKDFLGSMERTVEHYLREACETHNGGKATLDNAIASYVGMKLRLTGDKDVSEIN